MGDFLLIKYITHLFGLASEICIIITNDTGEKLKQLFVSDMRTAHVQCVYNVMYMMRAQEADKPLDV